MVFVWEGGHGRWGGRGRGGGDGGVEGGRDQLFHSLAFSSKAMHASRAKCLAVMLGIAVEPLFLYLSGAWNACKQETILVRRLGSRVENSGPGPGHLRYVPPPPSGEALSFSLGDMVTTRQTHFLRPPKVVLDGAV